MKPRLLVFSDLWGFKNSKWLSLYTNSLKKEYNVVLMDCCELGEINLDPLEQELLHQQFRQGGIKRAIAKVCEQETGEVDVLAFSIGGTIAWKAALSGMKINRMVAISATRLRLEVRRPECEIDLLYGERDNFRPSKEWFAGMELENVLIPNGGHRIYTLPDVAERTCAKLIGQFTS